MAKEKELEKLYLCSACKETYTGTRRKWTCPTCGNADTYEEAEGQYYEEEDKEEYYEEEDNGQ